MATGKLELAPTIRTAQPEEIPNTEEFIQKLIAIQTANIIEGYTIQKNERSTQPFTFFAEINIDNKNLWKLFKALALELPEEICLVYNHKDDDPKFSNYFNKHKLLDHLAAIELEITQDCLLEIGVLYHTETKLEEIFIRSPKYFQIQGNNESKFRQIMHQFNLYEVPDLNFIDEFPLVTTSLHILNSAAKKTFETLELIENIRPEKEQ